MLHHRQLWQRRGTVIRRNTDIAEGRRSSIRCDTATTTGHSGTRIARCITEGDAIRYRTICITGVRCINRRPGIPTGVAINNRPISNRISSRAEGDNRSANRFRSCKGQRSHHRWLWLSYTII